MKSPQRRKKGREKDCKRGIKRREIIHCILTQDENMKSKNKKIYITPELEFLTNETTLMALNSVGVYDEEKVDTGIWGNENDNLIGNGNGNIFFDKGQGNNGDYDPWDSDNW